MLHAIIALALSCTYVGSLYLLPQRIASLPRDHDEHVRVYLDPHLDGNRALAFPLLPAHSWLLFPLLLLSNHGKPRVFSPPHPYPL